MCVCVCVCEPLFLDLKYKKMAGIVIDQIKSGRNKDFTNDVWKITKLALFTNSLEISACYVCFIKVISWDWLILKSKYAILYNIKISIHSRDNSVIKKVYAGKCKQKIIKTSICFISCRIRFFKKKKIFFILNHKLRILNR